MFYLLCRKDEMCEVALRGVKIAAMPEFILLHYSKKPCGPSALLCVLNTL